MNWQCCVTGEESVIIRLVPRPLSPCPDARDMLICTSLHMKVSAVCLELFSLASIKSILLSNAEEKSGCWVIKKKKDEMAAGLCDYITHSLCSTPLYPNPLCTVLLYVWGPMCRTSLVQFFPKWKHWLAGGGSDWQVEKGMGALLVPYKASNESLYF